jgi:acetoin utilization deacetylase AcuC-like enzyme
MPEDWGNEVMSNIFVRNANPLRGVLAQAARYLTDGSCPVGENTWLSAYWSAQSAIAAAMDVVDGANETWALCRPPGHHARQDGAGGFCYLNNAALAGQTLRNRFERVVILDTDMHHGQGIQEIFYGRSDVLYVSIHGDPTNFYPVVAGYEEERGEDAGEGYNVNLPMPHGSSEEVFFDRVKAALSAIKNFKPDAIVLALGFDIYKDDPQSQVDVTTEGFARLGQTIGALQLPTVIVQEGGYHIESLEANAHAFFTGFRDGRKTV